MAMFTKDRTSQKLFRSLLLAAAIMIFGVIVIGGIVRSTGSGGACRDWPACGGSWLPPAQVDAWTDYVHRLSTLPVFVTLLIVAALAWRFSRNNSRVSLPVFGALGLALFQGMLGGAMAFLDERADLTAIHLGLSLLILGLVLFSLVAILMQERSYQENGKRISYHTPFARLSLVTLVAIFLLLVSGAVVSATGAGVACSAWPLCGQGVLPSEFSGWIAIVHRLVVAAVGILVAGLFFQAWRTQRSQTAILVASTTVGVLFFAQALLGASKLAQELTALHQATASAVWAVMIVQVTAVGLAGRTIEEEQQDLLAIANRTGLWKDLLMLTKPVVVILLLVITFTGMVIGAKAWPSWNLIFWTLLGGALAAGGSGAINQYIDRFDDTRMQRTERRPIPAGRLSPGEGLAFGVALCLVSFYLVVALVNLLAAMLVLAGIIYYVLIYSIFLKKTTVQNIVIGGGAGAIPPLVGWAAATGKLDIPAIFLFALVFLWTPPHFWALALVRRNDYARAGVPMLPVVRGEQETRWQILVYTIELVALTLFLPLFGLGRGFYLVSAVALGGWLLLSAWKVWRKGGNKTAWKMYRSSSMYLAFIFFALMVDRLIF